MAQPRNPMLVAEMASKPDVWVKKVRRALKDAGGNRARAASALNVDLRTLYRWLEKHPEVLNGSA